jgi:hypothetical protein
LVIWTRPARVDHEYERNGTANLFMMFAPLEGWRHVKVTDQHTAIDYAQVLKDLADIRFPRAKTNCCCGAVTSDFDPVQTLDVQCNRSHWM